MKPVFGVPAIFVFLFLAACGKAVGQTEGAKSTVRLALSPHQVERAAKTARNANRLLGSLLRVTSRQIEGRYFYQYGIWWYWMPAGYWMVWDGENWVPYQR
jgi:hypothetical protein